MLDVEAMNIDMMSLGIYGPKGMETYVRKKPRVRLQPLIHGGGQERGNMPTPWLAWKAGELAQQF